MALINMDKIGANLMAAMGVSPDQVRAFVITVLQEVQDIKQDRLAFRPASQRAYRDVVSRLDRLERNQAILMQHFGLSPVETNTDGNHPGDEPGPPGREPVANGHDSHPAAGSASGA